MALGYDNQNDTETDLGLLGELRITAERVERFRLMHEDAVRDLRAMAAKARAEGHSHADIDQALRQARDSVGRFSRLPTVD